MEQLISITVNGRRYEKSVPIRMLLVDFLRDEIGLTGTHIGCTYEGRCGACTVVLEGDAVKSCMMLAVQANNHTVLTVEGLEGLSGVDGQLHPIQEAFWECHGLQCGYCTPGMMMTIFDLLKSRSDVGGHDLADKDIRHSLVGNICRCTGYSHIVEAVKAAADRLQVMSPAQRHACFDVKSLEGKHP